MSDQARDDDLSIPADYVANMFDLKGRVAVITGGGSGLGRAIGIGFAQAGVQVVLADVNDEGAAETVTMIEAQGNSAIAEHLDVTARTEVEALADSVAERFGRVE